MNLNVKSVGALAPRDKRYYVYGDRGDFNIGVTVLPSGTKTWHLRTTVDGKTQRIRLGAFPTMNIERARAAREQVLNRLAAGGPAKKRELVTLEQAATRYCAEKRRNGRALKESTQRDLRYRLARTFADYWSRPLADIDAGLIERLELAAMKKAYFAGACRYLGAVWEYARHTESMSAALPEVNPVRSLAARGRTYTPPPRKTYVPADQLPAWWAAVHQQNTQQRDLLVMAIMTGARVGANSASGGLQHLRWQDITATHFRLYNTKNHSDLELPLPGYVSELLEQRRREPEKLVFRSTRNGRPGCDAVEKLIGARYTPHDLRRTFATIAEPLCSTWTLKRLMGHAARDITEQYAGVVPERLTDASARIEAAILEAARAG